MSKSLYSRPFPKNSPHACERCVFGTGEHAEWCAVSVEPPDSIDGRAFTVRQVIDAAVAAEREACAKVVEAHGAEYRDNDGCGAEIAAQIRARSKA